MRITQNCVCGKDPGSSAPQVVISNTNVSAADEIRAIDDWASVWNLEQKGLVSAIKRAGIPVIKVGRKWVCRRSDMLEMVDRLAAKPSPPTPTDAYMSLVESTRTRGGSR